LTRTIAGYTFEGPYISTNSIEDKSGVYAVLCKKDSNYSVVDVGESHTPKSRLNTHERKGCWERKCTNGTIYYAIKYTPNLQQDGRMKIEQDIRAKIDVPCGKT
jgi:hypothetical protein